MTKEEYNRRKKKGEYAVRIKCIFCGKWAYSFNPKLIPRHQHIGWGIR